MSVNRDLIGIVIFLLIFTIVVILLARTNENIQQERQGTMACVPIPDRSFCVPKALLYPRSIRD